MREFVYGFAAVCAPMGRLTALLLPSANTEMMALSLAQIAQELSEYFTMIPFPIQFSDIQPCQDLLPQGGICRYSVRITNRSDSNLRGAVWSLVDSDGIGALSDFTRLQRRAPSMVLAPGASRIARFAFTVPATVRGNSAYVCTSIFFGQGFRNPYFNVIRQKHLLCISKGADGFSAVPEEESQKWPHRQEKENRNSPRQLHRRSSGKSPQRGR